ncbi:MAG: DUF4956 domain-containing protein [Verrucomicrobia bacterium]|nr:DUF4956 domain-containing protein [Verrucomicrobiota bacterium]
MDLLFYGDVAPTPTNVPSLILSILLAFVCGHAMALCYIKTHSGMSYSRTFVSALLVLPVLTALVMCVLNNNLITAFGMMAVFAIVRFRNVLRDTLDTVYILCSLFIGMACGTQKFSTAVIGTMAAMGILIYIYITSFGSRNRYDLVLNLHWEKTGNDLSSLLQLINRYSSRTTVANQRTVDGVEGMDISYRLMLRDPNRTNELLSDLRGLEGVTWVSSVKVEDESEY